MNQNVYTCFLLTRAKFSYLIQTQPCLSNSLAASFQQSNMSNMIDSLYLQLQQLENSTPSHASIGKRGQVQIPTLQKESSRPVDSVAQPPPQPSTKKRKADYVDEIISPDQLNAAEILTEREINEGVTFETTLRQFLKDKVKTFLKVDRSLLSCQTGQLLTPVDVGTPTSTREASLITIPPSVRYLTAIPEDQLIFSSKAMFELYIRERLAKTRDRLHNLGVHAVEGETVFDEFVEILISRCLIEQKPYI